ncbi:hypothetical protein Tco_1241742 [Tanacetum coccineum]
MSTFEVLDELMEITGSSELHKRMRFWFVQELAEEEGLVKFLRDRCDDLRRKKARRRVLIGEMEASGARGVAVDSLELVFGMMVWDVPVAVGIWVMGCLLENMASDKVWSGVEKGVGSGIIRCDGPKWKNCLIKGDIAGNDDFVSGKVKATKSTVVEWVAKENTWSGAWAKFMVGVIVGITKTTKDT